MTDDDKLKLLEEWQKSYEELEIAFNAIETAFGCFMGDSHLFDSSWKMFEKYTEALAMILYCNTSECNTEDKTTETYKEWLSWYAYENLMGKKGFEAKAGSWKKAKKINNPKLLLKVMTE